MKFLAAILGALIILVQFPLWFGKGGWLRVWEVDRQLDAQKGRNSDLDLRNTALGAEVRDLKQGTEAIEERARYELGLIRKDEVFYQIEENRGQSPISTAAKK
jgi:cell division protein FtsB